MHTFSEWNAAGWVNTTWYYEDGTTMHKRLFADPNPDIDGDITYEEYNSDGSLFYRMYDTGQIYMPSMPLKTRRIDYSLVNSKNETIAEQNEQIEEGSMAGMTQEPVAIGYTQGEAL